MSIKSIRAALEGRLNTISPTLPTAWENVSYTPVTGTAYQRIYLLPDNSLNPTFGSTSLIYESGIFQVSLYYPINTGPSAAETRAELIRTSFVRGLTLNAGSVAVKVARTPSIAPAQQEGDWRVLPVSIPYYSHIYS